MAFLTALFDLNGTTTRKQALRVFLLVLVGFGVLFIVQAQAPAYDRLVYPPLGLILVWWTATVVRRLHEAGHSGAWAVLLAVPLLGLFVSLAALLLRSDRPYNNSHAGLRAAGTVVQVLLVIFWLSRSIWVPYWSDSEAMKPTLMAGDYQIVRYADADSLSRGDIVVFRHPVTGAPVVSRLIALPGDRVKMQHGAPVLNGVALPTQEEGLLREAFHPQGPAGVMPRCSNTVVGLGGVCELAIRREALPDGRSYLVGNVEDGAFADETEEMVVPPGRLFFLGDNRDSATDSRFAQGAGGLGFVPAENVIGRVSRVLFSTSAAQVWTVWNWRVDRIFGAVE